MKLGLSLVLFAACATTGTTTMDREPSSRAKVTLDLSPSTEEAAVFPALDSPRLPSVDRIAHQVRAQLGDVVTASIELCVSANGHVTKVAMLEGTGYEAFNAAVVRDIAEWQFASMPGATAQQPVQTCERAKVKYVTAQ